MGFCLWPVPGCRLALPSCGSEKGTLSGVKHRMHSAQLGDDSEAPCLASEGRLEIKKGMCEYRGVGLIRGAQRRC